MKILFTFLIIIISGCTSVEKELKTDSKIDKVMENTIEKDSNTNRVIENINIEKELELNDKITKNSNIIEKKIIMFGKNSSKISETYKNELDFCVKAFIASNRINKKIILIGYGDIEENSLKNSDKEEKEIIENLKDNFKTFLKKVNSLKEEEKVKTIEEITTERVESIKDFFLANGIKENQIIEKTYREEYINENKTPLEKALNRRVEIILDI